RRDPLDEARNPLRRSQPFSIPSDSGCYAHFESVLAKPPVQTLIERADDGVLQRTQRLADRQKEAIAWFTRHENELLASLDQLAQDLCRRDHELKVMGAGQELVRDRIAMTHPPDSLGTAKQDGALGVIQDRLVSEFADEVLAR